MIESGLLNLRRCCALKLDGKSQVGIDLPGSQQKSVHGLAVLHVPHVARRAMSVRASMRAP
jgi:hypothetical protein